MSEESTPGVSRLRKYNQDLSKSPHPPLSAFQPKAALPAPKAQKPIKAHTTPIHQQHSTSASSTAQPMAAEDRIPHTKAPSSRAAMPAQRMEAKAKAMEPPARAANATRGAQARSLGAASSAAPPQQVPPALAQELLAAKNYDGGCCVKMFRSCPWATCGSYYTRVIVRRVDLLQAALEHAHEQGIGDRDSEEVRRARQQLEEDQTKLEAIEDIETAIHYRVVDELRENIDSRMKTSASQGELDMLFEELDKALEHKTRSLRNAIQAGEAANLDANQVRPAKDCLEAESAQLLAEHELDSAIHYRDPKRLKQCIRNAQWYGVSQAHIDAAKAVLADAEENHFGNARADLQAAMYNKDAGELQAAIEKGHEAGLSRRELNEARGVAAGTCSKEDARLELAAALSDDGSRTCVNRLLFCLCDLLSPTYSEEVHHNKIRHLRAALEMAEASGLEDDEVAKARAKLANEERIVASLAELRDAMRTRNCERLRIAILEADEAGVPHDLTSAARIAYGECKGQFDGRRAGTIGCEEDQRMEKALQDLNAAMEGVPPPDQDDEASGCCGCQALPCLPAPEPPLKMHRIKDLRIAIQECEDLGVSEEVLEAPRLKLADLLSDFSKRMDWLEEHLNMLEEAHLKTKDDPPTVCRTLLDFYKIIRAIPIFNILAFMLTLRGVMMIFKESSLVASAVAKVGLSSIYVALPFDVISFAVVAVDSLALLVSFPATGAIDAFCLKNHQHRGFVAAMACLVGPCSVAVVIFMLIIVFLFVFCGCCFFVTLLGILVVSSGACRAEANTGAISGLGAALAAIGFAKDNKEHATAQVQGVCDSDYELLLDAQIHFIIGLALVTVGQAAQLLMSVCNLEMLLMRPEDGNMIPHFAHMQEAF